MGKQRAQHRQPSATRPGGAAESLQQAWVLYAGGRWQEAERQARRLLQARPPELAALTLLGVLCAQTERSTEAQSLLGRAAELAPNDPTAHNNYGNVLRDLGRPEAALRSYERALSLQPAYPEAHYNRGLVLHALGRFDEALASYDQAIGAKTDYAAAYNNRGVTLRAMQRLHEALASYEQAIVANPAHAAAHHNRGVILHQLGRVDEAVSSYEQALALSPHDIETLRNRGRALCALGNLEAAQQSYRQALHLDPMDAEAHHGLGVALQLAGDEQGALQSFEQATVLDPQHVESHRCRANLLRDRGELLRALQGYDQALAVRADHADTHHARGATLHELRRVEEALVSYQRALQLNPRIAGLRGVWLAAKMQVCDWSALEENLAALARQLEAGECAAPPFSVLTLLDSPALQRRAAELWAARTSSPSPLPPLERRERAARIRIGYYSADFHHHATSVLAEELFTLHDRDQFEIIGFRFGPHAGDDVTRRLAARFDRFIDVRARSDREVAQLSRELGIDIAVDMKGFTEHHRAGIFAARAAPVQVNYLGFPGTMGAAYMDYLVADRMLIPEDNRCHYSEQIAYLPHSYQVNSRVRPLAASTPSRTQLGLPEAGFVFCCFNSVYKITPSMFDVWMRVLARVPASVLWLLDGGESARCRLQAAAQLRGVRPERLVFAPSKPLAQHLARYRAADLFVDTAPCNAHTTASDALWAGLPLVTLAGESFASRVAASLLLAVGLPELVTRSAVQYEALLVALAADRERLARLRARLQQPQETPLFDLPRYVRHLEAAYTRMYERHL
ncbi:MAG TPA: tetratricopeptide repeat protein, partial [Steroidobacteraceae bacterium]|nr:tetratricopeptide repeat protein [Steroidobacteraceae bacterium]